MRNEWAIRLFSREQLDAAKARERIEAFASVGGGAFRPDRWGVFEPVRNQFLISELDGPSDALAKPCGSVLFTQAKPKQMEASVWNRAFSPESPFANPIFLTYWMLDLKPSWMRRIPWAQFTSAFYQLFQLTKADFGVLTTGDEYRKKHTTHDHLSYQRISPDLGMPGLYRFNLFSSGLAEWLRLDVLPAQICVPRVLQGGVVELVLGGTLQESSAEKAEALQETAIDWLGREKFFSIRSPARSHHAPEWDKVPSVPWRV